jgi:protein O-mannosyl-transferase
VRLAALLAVGTVLAYLPAWRAGFIWDDRSLVIDNPLVRSASGLWRFWFSTKPVDYYPVTSSLWWLQWRIWGENPIGYHAVNVLLHALCAVLLLGLLRLLRVPGSWLAAAIFAVHPVNVESVAWVVELKNVLAMFFYLASLYGFARGRAVLSADSAAPASSLSAGQWYALALLGFFLALLSKTAVAPMPLVLLGMLWWERGRLKLADVREVAPFFALAVTVGALSFWFQAQRAIGDEVVRADGFWARFAAAGWAIGFYAYKAILPFDLRSIYPRWQVDAGQWWSYLPWAIIVGAAVVCWRARRGWGMAPLLALSYFVVMLSPVLGFLNIGFMKFSLVADHWQYFAVIGPIVLFASALAKTYDRLEPLPRQALSAAMTAGLVGLASLSWQQSKLYRDSGSFWRAVLATDVNSWVAHNNLGGFLVEQGQSDEALPHFQQAVALRPNLAKSQYNLGAVLREKGQLGDAILHLRRAVDLAPSYVEAHNALARALAQKHDFYGAIAQLEQSLQLEPKQAEAHNNLANLLWQTGQLRAATVEYEQALALHPDYAAAHFNLGEVLRAMGDNGAAVAHFRAALKIRPELAERLQTQLAQYPADAHRESALPAQRP